MVLSANTMPKTNTAELEKKENSFVGGNDLSFDSYQIVAPLDMIQPSPIEMPQSYAVYGADWKPFGPVNTKYHAAWLFNPLKIC